MALQYSTFESTATSETTDVTEDFLSRLRGTTFAMRSPSLATATLIGRDRHPRIYHALGRSAFKVAPMRRRGTTFLMASVTESIAKKTTVMPPVQEPRGVLKFDDLPLAGRKLSKGSSVTIGFLITGWKIKYLTVSFSLMNLSGMPVLNKTVYLSPGGVGVDEIITNPDGSESIVGYIFLLPEETIFLGSPKQYELKYICELHNQSTRMYHIETDYLSFI